MSTEAQSPSPSSPPASGPQQIDRVSLGRQVANLVRRDILFGQLPPGTKISQQQLCDRFGVSRMPVRDALRQLTHEGLLVIDATGHSVVAHMGRADIEDSYLIEGMLHGIAVRRVTETMSAEHMAELAQRHEAMQLCVHDVKQFSDLNWSFHRRINQMAGSRKLNVALRTLTMAIPRDFVVQLPQFIERANVEHDGIIAAMKARDADKAETLTRTHVLEAGYNMITYLETQGIQLD